MLVYLGSTHHVLHYAGSMPVLIFLLQSEVKIVWSNEGERD